MGENDENVLDPITSLAVELEKLKSEVKSTRDAIAEKDKQMAQMMNANKRLVAELSLTKNSPNPPAIDSNQAAYKSFKTALSLKE